jgi:two-component system CheB/CheR fusion protein
MRLEQIDTLADYVVQMRRQPAQVTALHDDILIGVTSFLPQSAGVRRDCQPGAAGRSSEDAIHANPLRLWVVGCSTGQEAYSLAILLTEFTERHNAPTRIQIFATDLNANAIEHARRGVYPKEIAEDVSAERLQRFFVESEGGYRITKSIREACVFSRHNLLTDPPFSRIDLLSCRNLLIYLEPTFAASGDADSALRASSRMVSCGSVARRRSAYRTLFDTLDSKHKIYTKHGGGGRPVARASRRAEPSPSVLVPIPPRSPDAHGGLYREAERILLTRFAPPAVVVSNDLEIRQYRGDTSDYLTPAPGQASLNLLKMLREGLLVPVHSAIISAGKSHAPVRAKT